MVDYRITDLPAASAPLAGTEETELVQAGFSRKLSLNALWTWLSGQVTTLINAALAGTIETGDTAGGDLTGTYPNPTLAALSPSPAGSYLARNYTMVIDAKGRVLSMASTPAASVAAVLYTVQTLTAGEQLVARGNIAAEAANTRLSAISALVMVDSLVVWDTAGTAHIVGPIQSFMETVLAATDAAAARAALGIGLTLTRTAVTIDNAGSPLGLSNTDSIVHVDLTAGDVDVELPEIDSAAPTSVPNGFILDIGITGLASGNVATIASTVGELIAGEPDAQLTDDWDNITLVAVVPPAGPNYWRVL